ncbi:MAG: hypothetical protein D6689_02750 [Deltaproteobacteria bacterium]|nr:MAG: hypothetical protein D6689_02750 [Deltaproteobacteria bacterium]
MTAEEAVPVVHDGSNAVGPGDENPIEWRVPAADGGSGVHDVADRLVCPGAALTRSWGRGTGRSSMGGPPVAAPAGA